MKKEKNVFWYQKKSTEEIIKNSMQDVAESLEAMFLNMEYRIRKLEEAVTKLGGERSRDE